MCQRSTVDGSGRAVYLASAHASGRVQWHPDLARAYRDISISDPNPVHSREGKMPKQEPSGMVPANVNVSGQGIQVGPGNVQYNAWMANQSLDPVALVALHPHTAVARLQQLSHDELVDLFARASADDVAELLAVFLEVDEPKVVAVLADMNRRRSTELIKPLVSAAQWLSSLPAAVEAITREATALKWVRAQDAGTLERFSDGYVRKYKKGRVLWSDGHGAHAISGEIEEVWTNNKDSLDFPEGDSETAQESPFGTTGVRQPFESNTVYSSTLGVYLIYCSSMTCYEAEGGSAGWLGFPTGIDTEDEWHGWIQPFEGGAIYSMDGERAYAVSQRVVDALPDDQNFFPVSKEVSTESSFGTPGIVQRFQTHPEEGVREMAVYSPEGQPAVVVRPEIWGYYRDLGGEGSWLGWPSAQADLSPEEEDQALWTEVLPPWGETVAMASAPEAAPEQLDSISQDFEGGSIFWRPETGAFAVSNATLNAISQDPASQEKLGWPVSEDRPIGADGSDRIQFFDDGNVTVRDGNHEIWLRPDSTPGTPEEPVAWT
jgi:hypothetical protein